MRSEALESLPKQAEAISQPKRKLSIKANLLLLLVGLGLSLALCEAALRVAGMFRPPPYPPKCVSPTCTVYGLYEPFEPYGYRLVPSRTTKYFYRYGNPDQRSLTMVSNKHGFRSSRQFDKPDDRIQIIVFGDSQVFGEGVEESERFTNVLEAMQSTWRVDNLGMSGYGLDLMLRALEAVGLDLKPDVVVFSIYAGDFRRVDPYYAGIGFPIPRFNLESGRLVTGPYPEPRIWDRIRIFRGMRRVYWKYTNAERKLNAAILDRFIKLAEQHSFTPAIIFLPYFRPLPYRLDTREAQEDQAWLRQYAKRHAISFLDLTDPILKAGLKQVLLKNDPHLNPYGHQIVATELRRFLAKQVLNNR